MKRNARKFLTAVKRKCKKESIELKLVDSFMVTDDDGVTSNGSFDSENRVMLVAIGKPEQEWLCTLVHEVAHLDQYVEQTPIWKKSCKYNYGVEDWIACKKKDRVKMIPSIIFAMKLELDAEKRAIKMIKKHNLNIDIKDYIRRANAYVNFYKYIMIDFKWYVTPPYIVPEILSEMSDRFNMDYGIYINKRLKRLYRKHCI